MTDSSCKKARTAIQCRAGGNAVKATIPQDCGSSCASQGTKSKALEEHVERMDVEIYSNDKST